MIRAPQAGRAAQAAPAYLAARPAVQDAVPALAPVHQRAAAGRHRLRRRLMVAIMGIGGGFLLVPAMIYLLGMPTAVVAAPRCSRSSSSPPSRPSSRRRSNQHRRRHAGAAAAGRRRRRRPVRHARPAPSCAASSAGAAGPAGRRAWRSGWRSTWWCLPPNLYSITSGGPLRPWMPGDAEARSRGALLLLAVLVCAGAPPPPGRSPWSPTCPTT